MNVWIVILLAVVSVSLILYFLVAVLGVKSEEIFGRPLMIAIIVTLLAGLSYYLMWEKSIHVVIKSDEDIFYKSEIGFNNDIWNKEGVFVFSSVTRGIPTIDYSQQVKDFLAKDQVKLCRDYKSETIGAGRYEKKGGSLTICVNKKGMRWYF